MLRACATFALLASMVACCKTPNSMIVLEISPPQAFSSANAASVLSGRLLDHNDSQGFLAERIYLRGIDNDYLLYPEGFNPLGEFVIKNVPSGRAMLYVVTRCGTPCGIEGVETKTLKTPINIPKASAVNIVLSISCEAPPIILTQSAGLTKHSSGPGRGVCFASQNMPPCLRSIMAVPAADCWC